MIESSVTDRLDEYEARFSDPWASMDVLNACPYCEGAMYILAPCPVHGSTPLNTFFWIQNNRQSPSLP